MWLATACSLKAQIGLASTEFLASLNVASSAAAPTYLFEENFEGTGYENVVFVSGSHVDPDYTTSPLEASHSLKLGASSYIQFTNSTSLDEMWLYFMIRPQGSGFNWYIHRGIQSGLSTVTYEVDITSGGLLRVTCGTANNATTGTLSAGTDYHVWIHYLKGGGANDDTLEAWFNTTDTLPASDGPGGVKHAKITTGSLDRQVKHFQLGYVSGSVTNIYDKVRLDDEAIGSSPP